MKRETYDCIERFMLSCMQDSAHDREHVYRVLYIALDIASFEEIVNIDALVTACLLHDIGRQAQYNNKNICHAEYGSQMACDFLVDGGFDLEFARLVKNCISTHRYRGDDTPDTIEAKILFDADKLDATGAMGIARTLLYQGHVATYLYAVDDNKRVVDGTEDKTETFMKEYNFKLKNLYNRFYTKRGFELARQRQEIAIAFYENLLYEASSSVDRGLNLLESVLE